MKKLLLFYLPITVILSSCSWQEYFIITNESTKPLLVEYEIYQDERGFPIFDANPKTHKLTANNTIDWEKQGFIDYHEKYNYNKDSSLTKIFYRFHIPPKSALLFGHLSNDKYEKYNQYFINSRYFNIKFIRIYQNEKILEIVPSNFDNYFKKWNGSIACRIK